MGLRAGQRAGGRTGPIKLIYVSYYVLDGTAEVQPLWAEKNGCILSFKRKENLWARHAHRYVYHEVGVPCNIWTHQSANLMKNPFH